MQFMANPSMMIDKNHQIISTLGIGGAGEVYAIKNIKNNAVHAAKFARKDLKISQSKKLILLEREREIMEDLHDHPNILSSYNLFKKRRVSPQTPGFDVSKQEFNVHLMTSPFHLIEYCENGSFISYMRNQETLPENIVIFYTEQLISALEYIHFKGYAHLDVKLDNILLDNYFNVRLSDFGSALKIEQSPFTMFRRGTPKYMAPEVFNLESEQTFNAYKADIYSLGVCIFLMLFKRFPAYQDKEYPHTMQLFEKPEIVEECPFDIDESRWRQLSQEIRKILVACLNRDPEQRPQSIDLINNFELPPHADSIEDLVFEEMQHRRSKYEQIQHEKKMNEINIIQAAAGLANDKVSPANSETRPLIPTNKSGSSTNARTQSSK
jgi:serine/threonine protein kinase